MAARRLLLALALAAAACFAASGCADRPDSPARTNPFDPENPAGGGDPHSVRAVNAGLSVEISWHAVPIAGRSGYRVYRRAPSDTAFVLLETVGPGETSTLDNNPPRDAVTSYLVAVLSADGAEPDHRLLLPDSVDVPPLLVINEPRTGPDTTTVRAVRVHFFSIRAESIYLADSLDAQDAIGLRNAVAFSPDSAGYSWLLPLGGSPGGRKTVYGRMRRADGSLSPIASDGITIPTLDLAISVDGAAVGPVSTGRRAVTAAVTAAAGAESLEATFDSTFAGAWIPFATSIEESLPGPGARTLLLRVKNAFAQEETASFSVEADTLGGVSLSLNGGAAQTALATVNVHVEGGIALRICLANDSLTAQACDSLGFEAFDGVREGWALAGPRDTTVSVFARVANDWATTGVLSDGIFFLDSLPKP